MTEFRIGTLAELPFHVSGRYPKPELLGRCLGDRIEMRSSRQIFDEVRDLSLGLNELGVEPGDRVAILSDSRPEWTITDLAILTAGAITVPVYSTLPPNQVGYILAHSGVRIVVAADEEQASKVRLESANLPALDALVLIESAAGDSADHGQSVDDTRAGEGTLVELSLAEVVARGHRKLMTVDGQARLYKERAHSIDPDALATIIYTSGTTGPPKGVKLSHRNFLANLADVEQRIQLTEEDTTLSFLPLSHAFERTAVYLYLYRGATVVFAESLDTLGRDMQQVRPTVMTGVPRVYEKLRARILSAMVDAPRFRQALFAWALSIGHAVATAGLAGTSLGLWTRLRARLADRLVLSKIRARTGGRLRFVVSGSAPLSREVAEFLYAIGLPVLEGYGLTETAPVLTTNPLEAPRLGTVGTAVSSVELRIADDGEILARGPNVMVGYYENPEATETAIQDGWFHTGDIGHLDADGYLSITDRKKEILVTSGGKNVAPQPIEALLKRDPVVAEAMLIGDRRPYISVLLVPDFPALDQRLVAEGLQAGEPGDLVNRTDVRALFQPIIDEANALLASYEQVKQFALLPVRLSVETGELTPTLKIRRRVVAEQWKTVIDEIYDGHTETVSKAADS
jgi:long-chain acyl-CoA synthetase